MAITLSPERGRNIFIFFPYGTGRKYPALRSFRNRHCRSPDEIQQPGLTDFVGGLTDGIYGAASFDFESPLDPLSARKSWFFFDDEFVALGADISSDSDHPVATTLNQSLLTGDVTMGGTDGESILRYGNHNLEEVRWIHHDKTAYLFPEPAAVQLENQQRSGYWKDINEQSWAHVRDEETKDVFTLWIDHGETPSRSGYEYIVIPGIEAGDVDRSESAKLINILDNTGQIQAVQHTGLGISQIVFYEPGEVVVADGLILSAEDPGMVMVKISGQNVEELTVADPTRKLNTFRVTITSQIESEDERMELTWSEDDGVSSIEFMLPDNDYAGQSVTVKLLR